MAVPTPTRRSPLATLDRLYREHGDRVRLRLGPKQMFFFFHPDDAEHVLRAQAAKYRRSRLVFDKIIPVTGRNGLVQLEGEKGTSHRKITGQAVAPESLEGYFPTFSHHVDAFVRRLDEAASAGGRIEMSDALTDLVLANAVRAALGELGGADFHELKISFLAANELCGKRIRSLLAPPLAVPTANNRKLRAASARLSRVLDRLVARELAPWKESAPPLLYLLKKRGEDPGQIRDHLATYLFAGYETTASSMLWTFYLLAKHPEAQARAREEARRLGPAQSARDLKGHRYGLASYQESLRLFPPSWTLAREAVVDDECRGEEIPKGSLCLFGLRQLHTRPDFWEVPLEYRPERFQGGHRHPAAYIPFGWGSRLCIGAGMALMEASLILSRVLARYELVVDKAFEPEVEAMITAHPKNGLPVEVRRAAA